MRYRRVIRPYSTPGAGVTADHQLVEGRADLQFHGWAARELAGTPAPAAFRLRAGQNDQGKLLVPVELLANESTGDGPYSPGVACPQGIRAEILSGTIEVAVYASTVEEVTYEHVDQEELV